MLRSLWSGMSGLNVHQTALDVEANNIANVNTTSFKYSRVSFQDLLSQTARVSSAGGDNIGGTNAIQIGLGVKLASIEKIFKQGSLQQTDKVTDLALQGDGFFIVSGDGGETTQFTRAGNFHMDTKGDLVDGNGYKVQGWTANAPDYKVNTNNRISNISIEPGMILPAHNTEVLDIVANLSSSKEIIETMTPSSTLSIDTDLSKLFNAKGEPLTFDEGDSLEIVYNDPLSNALPPTTLTINLNYPSSFKTMRDIVDIINYSIKDPNGEQTNTVNMSGLGQLIDEGHWIQSIYSPEQALFTKIFEGFPTSVSSETLKSASNKLVHTDDLQELFNEKGEKIDIQNGQGIFFSLDGLNETRKFIYRETDSGDSCLSSGSSLQDKKNIQLSAPTTGLHWSMNSEGESANFNIGDSITIEFSDKDGNKKLAQEFEYGVHFNTTYDLACAINEFSPDGNISKLVFEDGVLKQTDGGFGGNPWIQTIEFSSATDQVDGDGKTIQLSRFINPELEVPPLPENGLSRMAQMLSPLAGGGDSEEIYHNNIYYFSKMADLQNLLQLSINESGDILNNKTYQSADVSLNDVGQIEILNDASKTFGMDIQGYPDGQTENKAFTAIFSGLNGLSVPDNPSVTRVMKAAYHIVSTDVFDDFGSKYPFDIHFKKLDSGDANGKIQWGWYADIGEPAQISSTPHGTISFKGDGSLSEFTPTTLTFSPNSGLNNKPVTINLNFGDLGGFDGVISQNSLSETMKIAQDGYTKGRLEDISINAEGRISGMFSNGRAKSLAQIGVARFKNNEGLESIGQNMYKASANSGVPWILTAGSAGTATIQNNSIERSNVDLSRSLIEMIVYQRGFQANSKTISTADEILKVLLELKR